MRIETMLNFCQKFKCFVYQKAQLTSENGEPRLEVKVIPRKNSRGLCSRCGSAGSCYDHQSLRKFEYVPVWGIRVFFLYQMRRIDCQQCGVTVEQVPWAEGKESMTKTLMQFLAGWAKKLSWQETARSFHVSWHKVFSAVRYVVEWGLKHRVLSDVESIGVDEVAWKKGHRYLTLVYQIDKASVRLLWIGKERTTRTLLRFFRFFGKENASKLKHVCSDMWAPYLKVIKKKASQAIHILCHPVEPTD